MSEKGSSVSEFLQSSGNDHRQVALDYLEKHKLLQIFELLGAKIAMSKPNDPQDFLLQELSKVSALLQRGQPVTLFTEKDIQTMFGFFDITGKGTVSLQQYFKALNACGIDYPELSVPETDPIDKKTFVKFVMAEVMNKAL
eukprot:TRINITY_DN103325_c0_g1_i1.p1 TRINITY_DN103325_c0_g1~~TRINITY_DN103325_c0_g1_i1.p1  ORF type:complete len:141 (+),score=10.07 TRINITY_DN103325_c0_g1_i1:25-447(+)